MRTAFLQSERREGAHGERPAIRLKGQQTQPAITAVAAMIGAATEALGVGGQFTVLYLWVPRKTRDPAAALNHYPWLAHTLADLKERYGTSA